jgi:hypothetical protein
MPDIVGAAREAGVDQESVELASTAAATMVVLLTTDAWSQVKRRSPRCGLTGGRTA